MLDFIAQPGGTWSNFGPKEVAFIMLAAFLLIKGLISIGAIRTNDPNGKKSFEECADSLRRVLDKLGELGVEQNERYVRHTAALVELVSQLKKFPEVADQIAGLWRMHDKMDDDGVPVWYVRRSLEEAIRSLKSNISEQNQRVSNLQLSNDHLTQASRDQSQKVDNLLTRGCPSAEDAREVLRDIRSILPKKGS